MTSPHPLLRITALVLASGAIGWLVAALPWLLEGGQLPISSAWPSVAPDSGPWVPLPAGEHRLSALLVTGGLVGLLPVVIGHLVGRTILAGTLGGALAGLLAVGDLWRVVEGLSDGSRGAELLVATHVGLPVLGLAVGLVTGIACCRGPRWVRVSAWGATVTVLSSWVVDLSITDPISISAWQTWLVTHQQHLLAAGLAVVLATAGWRPPSTLVGWAGALLSAWIIPAGLTSLSYLGSSAGSWASTSEGRAELVDGAVDVLRAALDPTHRPVWPLGVAVVLGVVCAAALLVLRSRRQVTDQR